MLKTFLLVAAMTAFATAAAAQSRASSWKK